jgi:hypothetical protein
MLADHRRHIRKRIRLRDEVAVFRKAGVGRRVVAGGDQHIGLRLLLPHVMGKVHAIHVAGHRNVREQRVDRLEFIENRDSFISGAGDQGLESALSQFIAACEPQQVIILDDQDEGTAIFISDDHAWTTKQLRARFQLSVR